VGGLLSGAAAIQAAAHERGAGGWGGGWGQLFTIETPEDGFADYVAACQARGRRSFLDGPHFGGVLGGVPGMIDWTKTVQGIAATVAVLTALMLRPAGASERIGTLPGSGRAPGAGCPRR
jgi:hypothetical protein